MSRDPMPLRKDGRSWLIYDNDSVEAAVRALETISLGMVGQLFRAHPDPALRGIANSMLKVGLARVEAALGMVKDVETTDELREAVRCAQAVLDYMAGNRNDYPVAEADQLYAALFHLDSRLNGMGLSGPGILRRLARGEI